MGVTPNTKHPLGLSGVFIQCFLSLTTSHSSKLYGKRVLSSPEMYQHLNAVTCRISAATQDWCYTVEHALPFLGVINWYAYAVLVESECL